MTTQSPPVLTLRDAHLTPHAHENAHRHRSDVTVLMLDRPRHAELIKQCREAGARIRLISDGDVGGAIEVRALSCSRTRHLWGLVRGPHIAIKGDYCAPCAPVLLCAGRATDAFQRGHASVPHPFGSQPAKCHGCPHLQVAKAGAPVDVMMGIGGTPEGVIAACALKCMGGTLQVRLWCFVVVMAMAGMWWGWGAGIWFQGTHRLRVECLACCPHMPNSHVLTVPTGPAVASQRERGQAGQGARL